MNGIVKSSEREGKFVNIRLAPALIDAIGDIKEQRQREAPLLPRPTTSDILRSLIAAEHRRISLPTCPICDKQTVQHPDPLMVGAGWCPRCQECVVLTAVGDGDGGKE